MWLEYIRYRFRLSADQSCLELAQMAALRSLRHSARCRSWRVLPAPGDPSRSILEIEWEPGPELIPFRGSDEFAELHSALEQQVKALDEADYQADSRLLRGVLGGPEALFRLAEDMVEGILKDPALAWRFYSKDGSRRGRLGLWLLEVLGGPDLFSSSFPDALLSEGPLAGDRLDLEERERLLEIAQSALPASVGERGSCVLGSLRACLPLHPPPPSRVERGGRLPEAGAGSAPLVRRRAVRPSPGSEPPESHERAIRSEVIVVPVVDVEAEPFTPTPVAGRVASR